MPFTGSGGECGAMLKNLPEHIRACHQRAAESREIANDFPDNPFKKEYLEMERRWMHLAEGYSFIESLERFLLDADKAKATTLKQPTPPDGF